LIIPDYFFDAKLFNKNAKLSPAPDRGNSSVGKTPERRHPSVKKDGKYTTPMSTKRAATSLYPFLEGFEYEESLLANKKNKDNSMTLIKKPYLHKQPTDVKTLFEILENATVYEHNRFVVTGYICGMSDYRLNKVVKKMDDNGKIYDFDDNSYKGNLRHIFHFIIFLKDSSVENIDRFLNVYCLTNEADQNLFDLWNILPRGADSEGWEEIEESKVNDFETRFRGLKNPENKIKMVVELLITNTGKPFLKLYDTVFLP